MKHVHLWGLFLLLLSFSQNAAATMIVVIYTPGGFWIGADSNRSDSKHVSAKVCKIHETKFGLLAKSGTSQGTFKSGLQYSTDKETKEILGVSEDVERLKVALRTKYKLDVDTELAFLVDDPSVTPLNIETELMDLPFSEELIPARSRTVILFDTNHSTVPGEVLMILPHDEKIAKSTQSTKYKYSARAALDWRDVNHAVITPPDGTTPKLPPSVREFSYYVPFERPDTWVRAHPEEAILEILQRAHEQKPVDIGPPYSILSVTYGIKPTVSWIQRGVCPGWAEKIDPKNNLITLRDALRTARQAGAP